MSDQEGRKPVMRKREKSVSKKSAASHTVAKSNKIRIEYWLLHI